jgi:hypothetical protein
MRHEQSFLEIRVESAWPSMLDNTSCTLRMSYPSMFFPVIEKLGLMLVSWAQGMLGRGSMPRKESRALLHTESLVECTAAGRSAQLEGSLTPYYTMTTQRSPPSGILKTPSI